MGRKKRRDIQEMWSVWLDPVDQLKLQRLLTKLKITEGSKSEKLRLLIRSFHYSIGA